MAILHEGDIKGREELLQRLETNRIPVEEAIERLFEIWPDDPLAYTLKATELEKAGDSAQAEEWFWKALERQPRSPYAYLWLAMSLSADDQQGALSRHLLCLIFRKLSAQETVPDDLADQFAGAMKDLDQDPKNPISYMRVANVLEKSLPQLPPDVEGRLYPFRVLTKIQTDAIDEELLNEVLENADRVTPVLRGALREWAMRSADDEEAVCAIAALVGEIGPPEALEELMQACSFPERDVSLHAAWGAWRLGQRFPAEALKQYRAMLPGDSVAGRITIAELVGMLPDTPGREEVLLAAVNDFAAVANDPDAPQLLLTAAFALESWGRESEVERLILTGEAVLPKQGRKLIRKFATGDESFVPLLLDLGISDLDIRKVCIEDALFLDKDDEEFDEEEFEDEEFDDEAPEFKPGRNDPCWCGSGKKYKKCHLSADEEDERARREAGDSDDFENEEDFDGFESPRRRKSPGESDPATLSLKVFGDLFEFAAKAWDEPEKKAANRLFFGSEREEVDEQEAFKSGFVLWLVYDYRPGGNGKTAIEAYLERRGAKLPEAEKRLLETWRNARYGLYEVQRVEEGTGVELKDYFTGDVFFVHDVTSSRELVQWDAIFSRIEPGEIRRFSGNGVVIPRGNLQDLVTVIEEESRKAGQNPAEFVRANSHRWYREVREISERKLSGLSLVNAEGDPLVFGTATYEVRDEDAVIQALERAPEFERELQADMPQGTTRFAWLEQVQAESRRSYGSIEIRGGKLRLECNSRERLEIGRGLVEKHAGEWLTHASDKFKSLEEAKARVASAKPGGRKKRESGIPKEAERQIVAQMKAKHYSDWADVSLAALNGKTPRQAVRSATGRKAVEDLLRMMENGEERDRKEGRGSFDFSGIRKDLGLAKRD